MNFEQILQAKLQIPTSERTAAKPSLQQGLDPAHLAFLLGQVPRQKGAKPRFTYPAAPPRPRVNHVLSEIQTEAYLFLQAYAPKLDLAFTAGELKKAYRHAVLQAHPDRGGTALEFMAVKRHYQILQIFMQGK